jgi:hypothetical protein
MSGGTACREPRLHREKWYVPAGRRNVNVSAFSGYRTRWSDYSDVICEVCPALWRSKARYVDDLPTGRR